MNSPSKPSGIQRSPSKRVGVISSPSKYAGATRSPSKHAGIMRSPSKLARFRETNWAAVKSPKKRPRDKQHADSALPPPKRLDLGQLPSHHQQQQQHGAAVTEEPASATSESDPSTSKPTDQDVSDPPLQVESESHEQTLQRELQVAECLEQVLVRDNARMKLKAERLREEVDYYYHVLVKIEHIAAQARGQSVVSTDGESSKDVALKRRVVAVAEGLQRIIRGSKSKPVANASTSPGVRADSRAADKPSSTQKSEA